jgi:hypothetical protein
MIARLGLCQFGTKTSTTTVADKSTGKVVGKPKRGEPNLRFDEGAKESGKYVDTARCLMDRAEPKGRIRQTGNCAPRFYSIIIHRN